MLQLITIAIGVLAGIRLSSAAVTPFELSARDTTPSPARIQSELGPKLCKKSSIYFPSSPEFGNYTEHWSIAAEGDILVVVVPRCDKDIAVAVR